MLMQTNVIDSFTHGVKEVSSFGFEMNAMAFQAVIDGIYADKVRAPVREYCTNAFDSHVDAGIPDKPFDVQLPSRFDPSFRVRDYGPGMSHDQIMGLYSTMFASSKRDSNKAVGMIGLGSKSAFAYTNVFTVTSWDGATERLYSAFLGEAGVPQIALLNDRPSDAPSGIEISFAVKAEDIGKFHRAARMTFMGFPVHPNVINETYERDPAETYVSGRGWRYLRGSNAISSAFARQGCVIYPIDATPLGLEWLSDQAKLLRMPFVIDFEIGDLNVATSREQLGYDARTIANIKTRLGEVATEIRAQLQAQIDAQPKWLDACLYRYSLRTDAERSISGQFEGNISYRGRPLERAVDYVPSDWNSLVSVKKDGNTHPGFHIGSPRGTLIEIGALKKALFVVEPAGTKNGPSRMRRLMAGAQRAHRLDPRRQ
ncbi:MAG: hypothetical protein K0R27_2488 [Xanthobacteraceae bacterium]|jgi:hypothetical protein|nr:hypothetical protein [Xanthobacteraceae bacterium]